MALTSLAAHADVTILINYLMTGSFTGMAAPLLCSRPSTRCQ